MHARVSMYLCIVYERTCVCRCVGLHAYTYGNERMMNVCMNLENYAWCV